MDYSTRYLISGTPDRMVVRVGEVGRDDPTEDDVTPLQDPPETGDDGPGVRELVQLLRFPVVLVEFSVDLGEG